MTTEIEKILKRLKRLNTKTELEQIRVEFEIAKKLVCRTIEQDRMISNLQKLYLKSIIPNVRYATLYKSDYVTIIDYICSVIEVVIHSAPLDKEFSKINTLNCIQIVKRINRILTGRSYMAETYNSFEQPADVEILNLEWDSDDW